MSFKRNGLFCAAALAVASTGFTAFGQGAGSCTPAGTSNGPDVIVGDIQGVANYTGTTDIDAFSLGTYSCNIGNVWLNWIAGNNHHPVITQNMLKAQRHTVNGVNYWTLEQVGQSWLKHGFYALSDNLCCNNCVPTDGTHLGVHCSDPYTATRNGGQGGAGPKWQVNAATGAYPFPPASPTWSGAIARRLQVHVTDLEPTSTTARYFGETQYVTGEGDEPIANRTNNTSFREVMMSGSGSAWNIALSPGAPTQRAKSGIRAWDFVETGITSKEIDVPEDGRLLVSAKATNLNNGTWHYEYVVQNMNSDRSVQGVSIPLPNGVQVTNIGFHDVDYHSLDGLPTNPAQPNTTGRNYDGTDWSSAIGNGTISWACETFDTNANANAIRWATLYNFRFDANTAPVAGGGSVTLALFKPGTPESVSASGIPVPSAPAGVPGDVDGDGDVDLQDLASLLSAFGACSGDAGFNASADFDHSNCIDLQDLATLLAYFGG